LAPTIVTGASGFVGRRVVHAIHNAGGEVRTLSRTAAFPATAGERLDSTIVGPVHSEMPWVDAHAVVHLAARVHVLDDPAADPLRAYREVNVDGTLRLARAAVAAGVRRFVFVSSVKVNGEATEDRPFTDSSPPHPVDPYGISKWEAEQGLRAIEAASDMEVVILRPPLVYGPGVKANFRRLLAAVDRGVPFPFGTVQNRRSLIFVGNLADAIVRAVQHPRAAGKTFLISDGPAVSSADLVRAVGHALDRSPRLLPLPPGLISFAGRILRREAVVQRLLSSLEIDDSRIRKQLEWTPPFTLEQGLAETAAWWRSEGRA
jgi:nucleoside-diphosphate-sugar epimerase